MRHQRRIRALGDHFEWAFVQSSLAEHCRVFVYDRRGHGASGPAKGSVADDVADLAALIDERVGGPAFLYGSSFGGVLALRLAAARPDLLRAVCAHEAPAFGLPGNAVDVPGDPDGVLELIREGCHEDAGVRAGRGTDASVLQRLATCGEQSR